MLDRNPDPIARDLTIVIPSKREDPGPVREIMRAAKCKVIVIHNKRYGEAIKEGIRLADTEFILTMDADGQHRYEDAVGLYHARRIAKADLMIGERRERTRQYKRVVGSTLINLLACVFSGRWVVDLNSGIRIFRRHIAIGYEDILCDDFSYTTSLAMSCLADGYRVEWFPTVVYPRRSGRSWVRKIHVFITIWQIIRIGGALRTRRFRAWLREKIKR